MEEEETDEPSDAEENRQGGEIAERISAEQGEGTVTSDRHGIYLVSWMESDVLTCLQIV